MELLLVNSLSSFSPSRALSTLRPRYTGESFPRSGDRARDRAFRPKLGAGERTEFGYPKFGEGDKPSLVGPSLVEPSLVVK